MKKLLTAFCIFAVLAGCSSSNDSKANSSPEKGAPNSSENSKAPSDETAEKSESKDYSLGIKINKI